MLQRGARGVALLSFALALSACPFVMDDSYEVRGEPTTAIPDAHPPPPPPACGKSTATAGPCPPGCVCPDATTCVLQCAGDVACKEQILQCPPGRNCRLSCTGEKACEKSQLTCNGEGTCDIECNGIDACKELLGKCSTGPCSLSCTSGCDKAKLQCGNNSCHSSCGDAQKPQLVCGPSCGCAPC